MMIRVTISEIKDRMSAYLRRVKSGETVIVMERKTPIARIVPVSSEPEGPVQDDEVAEEARLTRLEQAGIVRRLGHGSPLEALDRPLPKETCLLDALLAERADESGSGYR